MTSTSVSTTVRSSVPQARVGTDRRRHKRFAMTLLGRFMRESKHEYPCKLIDISVGGAAVMSPVAVKMGEKIIAYFDHLGGIEGQVSRQFEGGFAVKFAVTANKREKLAAQITWLLNKDHVPGVEERRHVRVTMQHPECFAKPQAGETMVAYDVTGDGRKRAPQQTGKGASHD